VTPPSDPRLRRVPGAPGRPGRPDRRAFLRSAAGWTGAAVVLGGFGLTACGDDGDDADASASGGDSPGSSTPTALTYQLSWLPTVEHAGAYAAIDKGYYEDEGLDVTLTPGGPNVQVAANVVGGQSLIGATGADNFANAIVEGAPLKVFAARLQRNAFCIVSLAESPISSPEEMIGKRIGVAQANTTPWQLFLGLNDIDESEIEVVPVQFDPSPVANGEVDGQMVFYVNEPAQLEVTGVSTHSMLFADHGFALYGGCYAATTETIESQGDLLAAFLRAERLGWADALADPTYARDLTIEGLGADAGLDPEQQLLQAERMADLMTTDVTEENGLLHLGEDDIAANIETLAAAGTEIAADDLFTSEILERL
jgi:ABC-type nitrate/sulfonate/bicarbonate transport system substrate-binding protein